MKGITAVVASVLLVLITIGIAGMASVFLARTAQTAVSSGEDQLQNMLSRISADFKIDYVDKNRVFIRNLGSSELKNMDFFVNGARIRSSPASIGPKEIGEVILDDGQLSMIPDPAELKVIGGIKEVREKVNFYELYTTSYWKFDEGSGTVARDSSRSSNDAALVNGTSWTGGKYGSAVKFDGVNDYVSTKAPGGFAGNASFTVSFWVKFDAIPVMRRMWIADIGNRTSQQAVHWLVAGSSNPSRNISYGDVQFGFWGNPQNRFNITSYTGQLIHVLTKYDNSSDILETYINGRIVGRYANVSLVAPLNMKPVYAYIGFPISGPSEAFFNGTIDEFRVLNVARSMTMA